MQLVFVLLFDVSRVRGSICFISELLNVSVSVSACEFSWSVGLCIPILSYHSVSVIISYASCNHFTWLILLESWGEEVEDSVFAWICITVVSSCCAKLILILIPFDFLFGEFSLIPCSSSYSPCISSIVLWFGAVWSRLKKINRLNLRSTLVLAFLWFKFC